MQRPYTAGWASAAIGVRRHVRMRAVAVMAAVAVTLAFAAAAPSGDGSVPLAPREADANPVVLAGFWVCARYCHHVPRALQALEAEGKIELLYRRQD